MISINRSAAGKRPSQNTTLHPIADRARADLEVLRHLRLLYFQACEYVWQQFALRCAAAASRGR
jgi:hypothetical protein